MNRFITITALSTFLVFMTGCIELENLAEQDSQSGQTNNNGASDNSQNAVEVVTNKVFESNTRIKLSSIGLMLTIPQEWKGNFSDQIFFMEAANIGKIIIAPHDMNEEESRQAMSNTIDFGNGLFLQPNSQVNQQGNILSAEYEVLGAEQPSVGYVVKVTANNGNGYVVVAMAQQDQLAALKGAVDTVVSSMSYFQIPDKDWAQELAGTKLMYYNTGDSYRKKIVIVLCSDGNFSRSSEGGGFNSAVSYASESSYKGQWSTSGNANSGVLQLTYDDGDVGSYDILVNDEGLFLSGKRYYREDVDC